VGGRHPARAYVLVPQGLPARLHWVSEEPVEAVDRVVVDDLIGRHARARIELRITPSIWPFWRRVANSSVEYSGSRLRNAAPHPDQFS
jgi:hypothetical protein